MNSNDNNDTEMISDLEDNTMTVDNSNLNLTFTLTQEQAQQVEELRLTTIAGNDQQVPKSQHQQLQQIVEYGIRALMQQRKQYQRQRQALKAFKG